jgi:hypothetical protein
MVLNKKEEARWAENDKQEGEKALGKKQEKMKSKHQA